jgi:hypothetical protein
VFARRSNPVVLPRMWSNNGTGPWQPFLIGDPS